MTHPERLPGLSPRSAARNPKRQRAALPGPNPFREARPVPSSRHPPTPGAQVARIGNWHAGWPLQGVIQRILFNNQARSNRSLRAQRASGERLLPNYPAEWHGVERNLGAVRRRAAAPLRSWQRPFELPRTDPHDSGPYLGHRAKPALRFACCSAAASCRNMRTPNRSRLSQQGLTPVTATRRL